MIIFPFLSIFSFPLESIIGSSWVCLLSSFSTCLSLIQKKKWAVLIFKNFSNFHSLSSSLRLLSWRIPDSLLIALKPGIRASWVSSLRHPVWVIYLSPGFDRLVPNHCSFFFFFLNFLFLLWNTFFSRSFLDIWKCLDFIPKWKDGFPGTELYGKWFSLRNSKAFVLQFHCLPTECCYYKIWRHSDFLLFFPPLWMYIKAFICSHFSEIS